MIKNLLSIDVESFLHDPIYNSYNKISKELDQQFISHSIKKILDIFDTHNTKITFFVVGELLEWYPDLAELILQHGHELAFHTYSHQKISSHEILINELKKLEHLKEKYHVNGFRAPYIFFPMSCYKLLADFGYIYSSSTYSVSTPAVINKILEIPVSIYPYKKNTNHPLNSINHLSLAKLKQGIPYGSGFFVSLFGKKTSWFIKKTNSRNDTAHIFLHNYQLYPCEIHKNKFNIFKKNPFVFPYLRLIEKTLHYLLDEFKFQPISDLIKEKGFFNNE